MKKTKLYLLFAAIAMVLLTAGVSYAWLARQQASMDTLLSVLPPDTIVIIPVSEGGDPVTELDLDYRKEDIGEDGTVTVRRPVCVQSSYPAHHLEVVHTTNLSELTFKIYHAPWNGTSFSLPEGPTALSGKYINIDNAGKLATPDKTLNGNYEESDIVEAHAYPLYWLADKPCKHNLVMALEDIGGYTPVFSRIEKNMDDPHTGEKRDFYFTYYYLEISWKETTKETDLFYILAHTVDK